MSLSCEHEEPPQAAAPPKLYSGNWLEEPSSVAWLLMHQNPLAKAASPATPPLASAEKAAQQMPTASQAIASAEPMRVSLSSKFWMPWSYMSPGLRDPYFAEMIDFPAVHRSVDALSQASSQETLELQNQAVPDAESIGDGSGQGNDERRESAAASGSGAAKASTISVMKDSVANVISVVAPGELPGNDIHEIDMKAHDKNRAVAQRESVGKPFSRRTAVTAKARQQIIRWLAPTCPEMQEQLEEESEAMSKAKRAELKSLAPRNLSYRDAEQSLRQ